VVNRFAPGLGQDEVTEIFTGRAKGNFLYASRVIPMLRQRQGTLNRAELATLPSDLAGIYMEFLTRICPDTLTWRKTFAPLIGPLAVARQPLEEKLLADLAGTATATARTVLAHFASLLIFDESRATGYWQVTIYHSSFSEFLLDRAAAYEYWCSEVEEHLRFVNHVKARDETWSDVDWSHLDIYLLQNFIHHVIGSGRLV
jgi:hypothetical protein